MRGWWKRIGRRSKHEPELELIDTGALDGDALLRRERRVREGRPRGHLGAHHDRFALARARAFARASHALVSQYLELRARELGTAPELYERSAMAVDVFHPELGEYEMSFEPSPALRELSIYRQ